MMTFKVIEHFMKDVNLNNIDIESFANLEFKQKNSVTFELL